MRGPDRPSCSSSFYGSVRRCLLVASLLVATVLTSSVASTTAAAVPFRVDLKVLVLDDNSPMVGAVKSEMQVEGVPYTAVSLGSLSRPVITDAFLASGDEARYQAVVGPDYALSALSDAERAALRGYEAKFGVREIDTFNYPSSAFGLNPPAVTGDINGTTATVTAAGLSSGFGYLNGPVPFSVGSYTNLAEPLAAASQLAGASYTTLVGAPLPNGATGSIIGVYSNAGVEQMIITAAFSFSFPQFKLLAHGIVSWATRGVHFGYERNNLTFHVDDAFSSDALWNSQFNCTPGEDCLRNADGTSTVPETSARMTPADVTYAVNWEQANGYQLTLAFNGSYANPVADPLTQSLQANAQSFRWLNHGSEHIYQGCVQNFTVVPWQCTASGGQVVWVPQSTIYAEIHNNILTGQALGLPFDPTEYLSGEHSGLFLLPQQPLDNPNFAAALNQAGILHIGSDASRDPGTRQVGNATTIPRHPTALYYNTATQADAVDEYNWLYSSAADGGSGYCEANPATATCIAPLNPTTGFTSYIVPTDAAFDMSFILSNDPRPFYAHTSNMTGDRLLYPLLTTILGNYRAAFTPATPVVNLTLTQAATALGLQTQWATTGTTVSGFVQNGQITITNPSGVAVPFTAPTGTTITGATLQPYGGELSAWLTAASTTGALPPAVAPVVTVTGGTAFVVGTSGTINIAATSVPASTVSLAGALPAGLAFAALPGAGTITGTPIAGTGGSFPLTITAVSGTLSTTKQLVITVSQRPQFTSAGVASTAAGAPFSFAIAATGFPTPTITRAGTLPTGITFTAGANGSATLTGTPTAAMAGRSFPVTFTATNSAGVATQAFTLTIAAQLPKFTSAASASAAAGQAFSFTVTTTGLPAATIARAGTLPAGITFRAGANGTATLSGTPSALMAGRSFPVTFTATNSAGVTSQTFTLTVGRVPSITSGIRALARTNRAFSLTVQTVSTPTATITMTGALPTGVTFVDNHNGTARISGTPARGTARTYTVVFTAKNIYGSATRTLTLIVR